MEHQYPPLLTAQHVSHILTCHITTAYEIMKQPHRPRWQMGKMVRLHRDLFLEQLAEETKQHQKDGARQTSS